jgi:peptidoglycan/xylan/chitin deacetylase (PgdA/CDA1 family)
MPEAVDLPEFMRESKRSTNARTFSPRWPGGARCAASLTVHVDGQTVWDALGFPTLHNFTAGEFGPRVGVWRILDVLERRGLKASFYVPGWTAETYPGVVQAAVAGGHEIGYHGYTHMDIDRGLRDGAWDPRQEAETLDRTLEILERIGGQRPVGHCFPHSPSTLDMLLERGFLYSNFHQADDIPYWWWRDGGPTRLLELPFDWILSDSTQYLHLLAPWVGEPKAPERALETWKAEFDGAYREGRYFILTIHPEFSGRASRIQALDELLEYITGHDDVWWTGMDDAARYWHETYPPEAEAEAEAGSAAVRDAGGAP